MLQEVHCFPQVQWHNCDEKTCGYETWCLVEEVCGRGKQLS
jgi:hypothetical protein